MNTTVLHKRLHEKEQELLADMARTEAEARALGTAESEDSTVSSEGKEALFQETTSDWNLYALVRDALLRIESGTYGTCVDCGNAIEADRLDKLPWTPYCLEDQDRHDRQAALAL
ncbi:MAG: TraR/DksA C4-type zinc finger protein [Acidobacteriia bacterium]|nr:TraR/DksA C4-type zinc finger protein [Terriglobia bacterium]